MSDPASITLIVCTRNRARRLGACLDAIRKIQCPIPWSLVMVDNGSTDRTRDLILSAASIFPVEVQYVHEPVPGLGNARNAGVRAAQSEILTFTDDDCYPASDYLACVANCFANNPHLGYLGGKILLHDPDDAPATILLSNVRRDFSPRSFLAAGVIQGANFSCRRSAILSVGGFDPWFGTGASFPAEEIDLLARLSAAGWFGAYDPRPTVSHHHGRKHSDLPALRRGYDRGRGAYYAKSILNPIFTRTYLRVWLSSILRHMPWRRSCAELIAGTEFWIRAAWDRGRRFQRVNLGPQPPPMSGGMQR